MEGKVWRRVYYFDLYLYNATKLTHQYIPKEHASASIHNKIHKNAVLVFNTTDLRKGFKIYDAPACIDCTIHMYVFSESDEPILDDSNMGE